MNANICNTDVEIVGFDLLLSDARFRFYFKFYSPSQYDPLSRNRSYIVARDIKPIDNTKHPVFLLATWLALELTGIVPFLQMMIFTMCF